MTLSTAFADVECDLSTAFADVECDFEHALC